MPLLKPPRLRIGDKIGVISPAGPVPKSELEPGLRFLESRGLRVHVAPHVYDAKDYLAGKDSDRLEDLHSVFRDRKIKAVFCTRGGYGCMRLLKDIDYDLIRESPKILVGYSDITALILAVYNKCGLVTFHGPMIREYIHGKEANLEDLIGFLLSKGEDVISMEGSEVLRHGRRKGRLLGGNLSLICHLLGTSYLPSLEGGLLFLEDKGEAPYRIDRMLTHLMLSGQIEGLAGLVSGNFERCGESSAVDKLLEEFSSGFDFPIVRGFHLGHGLANTVLPIGVEAEIDTKDMTLKLLESWAAG